MDLVILRFGEIGTKGKNRIDFINNLLRNIKQIFLRDTGMKIDISSDRSRIYLKTDFPEEIRDKAYIYFEKISGLGGIPVEIEGRVLCLIDLPLSFYAGYGMMKRGCEIFPVFFEDANNNNVTNSTTHKIKFDLEDAEEVVDNLRKYSPNKLVLNKISKSSIKDFANQRKCIAIAVADTLESMHEYGFPTLRPCIVEF